MSGRGDSGPCNVCKKSCSLRCSRCKAVYYCGAEHQKSDWSTHSKACKALAQAAAAPPGWNPPKHVTPKPNATAHETFSEWLKVNGVKGVDKLDIADFELTGRGLKATESLEADQVVLEVPRTMFVTLSDSVRNHPELSKVFSDLTVWSAVSQSPDVILAIRLLYEKHSAKNSPWKPWLDLLPTTYSSPLFWSSRDMDLLATGNIYHMIKRHKQQIEMEYAGILRQTLAKRFPQTFKPSVYTEDEWKWAMGTIYSRAVDAVVDGGEQRIIVPMMDMANHSFDAVVKHAFDASSNTFRFTTTAGIAANTQVYINYGPIGNSKMLHMYGFCIAHNPYDYVQMFLAMDSTAELYEEKKEILAKRNIEPSATFYLRADDLDRFPLDILGTARVQRVAAHDMDRIQYAFDEEGHIISEENEVHTLKALEEGLKAMFLMYSIAYKDDLELAEAITKGEAKPTPNQLHSLYVRMGDRQVIARAGDLINEMTEAIRAHLQARIDSGNTTPLVPTV